jgi:hypothetical protein
VVVVVVVVLVVHTSDHDFSLHRLFMKRKTGGAHLKELSEQKDGDFEPEEIFFDTTKQVSRWSVMDWPVSLIS